VGVLIDTSVLVATERQRINWDDLLGRGVELDEDESVAMAAISAAELLHGVQRLKGVPQARASLYVEALLEQIPVRGYDLAVARVHAALSASLATQGTSVGAHDLIIAATAVTLGYDVATRDMRSFPRIEGLKVRRW
jgi:predicted nucleic acid-binding protein